ncbi:hypothetical protein [Georgenia sp. SUBG003]|uniref:hypothetical protein n=1 Tax=Georgenia sp. SUBG003 TaxID=1497974 RepID=UPI003AB8E995
MCSRTSAFFMDGMKSESTRFSSISRPVRHSSSSKDPRSSISSRASRQRRTACRYRVWSARV